MYQVALMAVGTALKAYGQIKADEDQAASERENASFYREQADFAKYTGERKQDIFANETSKLMGHMGSAFAKAGTSSGSSSLFMAKELLYRQKESNAIKLEADMNVRLAMLRANHSQKTADSLSDEGNQLMQLGGTVIGGLQESGLTGAQSKSGNSTGSAI